MEKYSPGIFVGWNLAAIETKIAQYETITPELMLCGLTKLEDFISPIALNKVGLPKELQTTYSDEIRGFLQTLSEQHFDSRESRHRTRKNIGIGEYIHSTEPHSIHRSEETKKIFQKAELSATKNGVKTITVNYLFTALIDSGNKNIDNLLSDLGINKTALAAALISETPLTNSTIMPEDVEKFIQVGEEVDSPCITLEVKSSGGKPRKIIKKQTDVIIGRSRDNPIDLDLSPDLSVSRLHAHVFYRMQCWWIEDLNSKVGTKLNGKKINDTERLASGSEIKLGNTVITVYYFSAETISDDTFNELTSIEAYVSETEPPELVGEDERIAALADMMNLVSYAKTRGELFEGCINQILKAIPKVERVTILIDTCGELFPEKFFPRDQAYFSSTWVKKVKETGKAFSWVKNEKTDSKIPASLFDAVSAMYVPIIKNRKVIGVVHADSKTHFEGFTEIDLNTLIVIASSFALAIEDLTVDVPVIPSVFISYAHKDADFANRLKNDLRRKGISVWIDERLKVADDSWRKQLGLAIKTQQYFIFILSPASTKSKYCEWELDIAQSFDKLIIPIMLRKTDLPITISSQQYIDFRSDYDQGLVKIIESIIVR